MDILFRDDSDAENLFNEAHRERKQRSGVC
jgi:hypothetical protein